LIADWLTDLAYYGALGVAWPFLLLKRRRTGKYRGEWGQRLGKVDGAALEKALGHLGTEALREKALGHNGTEARREVGGGGVRRVMIHCVSVGELLSVRALIDALRQRDPALQIVVTTTTDTGTARARELFANTPGMAALRYPLDLSWSVARFLDVVQPTLVLLVELETWPNFLRAATRRKIPVVIINGRLTERSFKRYKLIRPIMRGMLRRLTWMGIQTEAIAARFVALGAERDKIEVIPTLKYDAAASGPVPGTAALARALGITVDMSEDECHASDRSQQHAENQPTPPDEKIPLPILTANPPLLVAGSTGPGEETIVLDAFLEVRKKFPTTRLAIAPRKPESVPLALEAIRARNLTALQRTAYPDATATPAAPSPDAIIVLDTLGELRKLYALATAVFVGRSLIPLGGSDMIEVAALGKPICVGPHTTNFAEVIETLAAADAISVVTDQHDLAAVWLNWLTNPATATNAGQRGKDAIDTRRGAAIKYQTKIAALRD
jgi:3-deoxy-D-manno-octulosonic-acid transferase